VIAQCSNDVGAIIEIGQRVVKGTRSLRVAAPDGVTQTPVQDAPSVREHLLEAHRKLILLDASNGGQLDL